MQNSRLFCLTTYRSTAQQDLSILFLVYYVHSRDLGVSGKALISNNVQLTMSVSRRILLLRCTTVPCYGLWAMGYGTSRVSQQMEGACCHKEGGGGGGGVKCVGR